MLTVKHADRSKIITYLKGKVCHTPTGI